MRDRPWDQLKHWFRHEAVEPGRTVFVSCVLGFPNGKVPIVQDKGSLRNATFLGTAWSAQRMGPWQPPLCRASLPPHPGQWIPWEQATQVGPHRFSFENLNWDRVSSWFVHLTVFSVGVSLWDWVGLGRKVYVGWPVCEVDRRRENQCVEKDRTTKWKEQRVIEKSWFSGFQLRTLPRTQWDSFSWRQPCIVVIKPFSAKAGASW